MEICASASERAQVERDEGRLRAARESLITCAAHRCPGVIRQDCVAWLQEVEGALPTVVLSGIEGSLQRVEVDGELVSVQLGRAFAVDPGRRRFVVETSDGARIVREVVVREGEKSQPIELSRPKKVPETPSDEGFTVPVGAWVLAGVGLAGVGVFAGLSAYAKSEVDDMRVDCAPFCPQARVDDARAFLLGGNVSLGLGIAAIGAALTWTIVEATTTSSPEVALAPGGLLVSGW